MKLTDNEIRDINRYLKDGKPLPDLYRFLLFDDDREVELVWNGKTNEVTNVVLPFQTIEQVDEPRSEKDTKMQQSLFDLDSRGRQLKGWTNKLIWGDNKLILSSLKNGPVRDEIEAQGGIKLIYIDPPFDVGADFSMDIEIGDEQFTKQPSVLEELAYRDTWGKGSDSYVAMLYERIFLLRDLLSDNGSIYIHLGKPVAHLIKLVCDEVFGQSNFINDITWKRSHAHSDTGQGAQHFGRVTESILFYVKNSENFIWNPQFSNYTDEILKRDYKYTDEKTGEQYRYVPVDGPGGSAKGNPFYDFLGVKGYWRYSKDKMQKLYDAGEIILSSTGKSLSRKKYLKDAKGTPVGDLWDDVNRIAPTASERIDYPTQKPEALIERIIKTSSNENDLVADFFAGSGTTLAVAEKLGRKWIGSDLGKFSIHTSRKRLIQVQRELKKEDKDYRAFEILNLGKYERQLYVGINPNLRDEEKQKQLIEREVEFTTLILLAYKAEMVDGFKTFYGKKNNRLVAIGPINTPLSRAFVEEVIKECQEKQITKGDILAFEFEMGLFPNIQEEAKSKGIDLILKYIPRDVFDKRAIEKNQVVFYDVSYIEVKPLVKKNSIAIELTDFSVFYTQETVDNVASELRPGGTKVTVEGGQIIKVSKDKKTDIISREVLTKKWTDWIDYWSVDFNFESKKETVRVKRDDGKVEERWTGDYIFENEWQSFRTKKDRNLELTSVSQEVPKGRRKIAVKVVDIFGNDTMKVIEVTV